MTVPEPREVDRSPAITSSALAVVAAGVSVVGTTLGEVSGALAGVAGLVVLGLGLVVASRRAVTAGCGLLFVGILHAGAAGAGPEPLLVGTVGAVVAWDVGDNAIGLGRQLGRAADTRNAELVHAAASLAVGGATAGVGYGVYLAAAAGQPLTALVFLLLGAVVLVSALGR